MDRFNKFQILIPGRGACRKVVINPSVAWSSCWELDLCCNFSKLWHGRLKALFVTVGFQHSAAHPYSQPVGQSSSCLLGSQLHDLFCHVFILRKVASKNCGAKVIFEDSQICRKILSNPFIYLLPSNSLPFP